MSSKIRVLSDTTINQIAAGEVIESPASVVKELVENALDAGAKKIIVEMQGGGLHLLRITDDGSGMNRDDALLCLERHATSKIHDAKDLFSIQTMGFRGEALASIASISKMTLTTSLVEIGVQLEVEAGKIKSIDPHPRNRGTTIEVRHLFYNVPARKKFQKSPSACASEITRALTNLSLGHPGVSFTLYNHDELVFNAEASRGESFMEKMEKRIADTLGAGFLSSVIQINEKEGPLTLQGIIGTPENTRHNRAAQHLFINQRAVISPSISFAIRDAYGTRIASDRHPAYVLHIDMPYHLLDVNVHPQKKEVRIAQEPWIKEMLQKAIRRSLEKPAAQIAGHTSAVFADFSFDEDELASFENRSKIPPSLPYTFREERESSSQTFAQPTLTMGYDTLQVIGLWSHYLLIEPDCLRERISLSMEEGGLCLVDLYAAKSRVIFERLLTSSIEPCHKQGLMFPLSFEMSVFEAKELLSYLPNLDQMGFGITQAGPRAFMVDAIPSFLEESDVQNILHEITAQSISLDNEDTEGLEMKKVRHLAEVSCRFVGSRKGMYLLNEAIALVQELLKTSSPCHCPQGSKTIAYLSAKDVSTFFSAKKR